MKIVSYVAPKPENEYREDVLTLKDATDNTPEGSELPAGEFEVPADKLGRAKRLIGEAAREDADRTATFVGEVASKDGKTVTLTIVLKPRRKTPVRNAAAAEPTAEEPTAEETASE